MTLRDRLSSTIEHDDDDDDDDDDHDDDVANEGNESECTQRRPRVRRLPLVAGSSMLRMI